MSDHDKRRFEDSAFGRVIYAWPLIVGICTLLTGVGAFISTIKTMGNRVETIETWITNERQSSIERDQIMDRLTTLEEVTDKRLNSLEDWRNGMEQWNIKRHH